MNDATDKAQDLDLGVRRGQTEDQTLVPHREARGEQVEGGIEGQHKSSRQRRDGDGGGGSGM